MFTRVSKILIKVVIFLVLTILTQVGGLFYLFYLLCFRWLKKAYYSYRYLAIPMMIVVYLICNLLILPAISPIFGRVALPITSGPLRPLSYVTILCNRHYVKPRLNEVMYDAAVLINRQYPGTTTLYLDANFPFADGFPLIPHLSHNDGKKLDLAFYYRRKDSGHYLSEAPSPIGYGIYEAPKAHEINQPEICRKSGYSMMYNLPGLIFSPFGDETLELEPGRTGRLLEILTRNPEIQKIFIEPHLKQRLQLNSSKIRYHGCYSVRHDDHIHLQIN